MLKRDKPTLPPSRFTTKNLISLVEAASGKKKEETDDTENQQKSVVGSGGGFDGSGGLPEKGFGLPPGGKLEPLSAEGALYSVGLPLAAMRAGLGLKQADFFLSKMPLGMGQYAGMGLLSATLPQMLRFAGNDEAASEADKSVSEYEGQSLDPDDLDVFDTKSFYPKKDSEDEKQSAPKTLQAQTVKYGGRELSVKPDSIIGKMKDPYKIKPFVDYANQLQQQRNRRQQQEKDIRDLGKKNMPTGKF